MSLLKYFFFDLNMPSQPRPFSLMGATIGVPLRYIITYPTDMTELTNDSLHLPPTELIELGLRIKEIREKEGFSKKKFALVMNMNATYLSELEAGRRNPRWSTLFKIATGLGVQVKDLFSY